MIRDFYIDNFKSLVDFSLPAGMGQFTCIVGLNGAGKSTLLKAFDFVGQLTSGRIKDWLTQRDWEKSDLTSRFLNKQLIAFKVGFDFPELGSVVWEGAFNASLLRCTSESITCQGQEVLKLADGVLRVTKRDGVGETDWALSGLTYQGSSLSLLKVKEYHAAVQEVKAFTSHLRSLDMLSPHLMRKRAKDAKDVGYGGERLSAYLHGFSKPAKQELLLALQGIYQQVSNWETSALRSGLKDLRVQESYQDVNGKPLETPALQLNDGMLRVLTILAQTLGGAPDSEEGDKKSDIHQDYRCLLFDEIENGINPEIVGKLVAYLLQARQQIIVTSHSPMILNYLPDEVARQAVVMLYRNADGHTRAVRFFDLPETNEKLELLGPGEVFVDSDLAQLAQVAEVLRGQQP